MSSVDTGQPETLKLAIIGAVLLFCAGAFGVHKFHQFQAAKAETKAVNAYIAQDPVFQMILKDHPAAKRYMVHFLSQGYAAQGEAGLKSGANDAMTLFYNAYVTDYNWYASSDSFYTLMSYQYTIAQTVSKNPAKKNKCELFLFADPNYTDIKNLVGNDLADKYMEAERDVFLSARDKKLVSVWPGSPNFSAAITTASFHLDTQLMKFDPNGFAQLAQKVLHSSKLSCDEWLEAYYGMLLLPRDEMALLWREGLEAARPHAMEIRKMRHME